MHPVRLKGLNYGGKPSSGNPASLAYVIKDADGNIVFDTKTTHDKWSKDRSSKDTSNKME